MRGRDPRRLGLAFLIIVAGVALAAQMVAGRDVVGPLGLPVLLAPPLALAAMLGAGRRGWPERVLVCLALILALTVLAGIGAALSPEASTPAPSRRSSSACSPRRPSPGWPSAPTARATAPMQRAAGGRDRCPRSSCDRARSRSSSSASC